MRRGFTLVELLISIGIIAVLVALMLASIRRGPVPPGPHRGVRLPHLPAPALALPGKPRVVAADGRCIPGQPTLAIRHGQVPVSLEE